MHYVEHYFDNGTIPEHLRPYILTKCSCGYRLLLNEKLTELKCSNPVCPAHMSMRMDDMFKQLNMKDIGPSTCYDIIVENNLVHHTQVFALGVNDMPSRNSEAVKEKFYNEIHKVKKLSLSNVAKLLRIEDMQTRCEDIFKGYSDIDLFYKDFNYNEDFISNQLRMNKGVLTAKFTEALTSQELNLRGLCKLFTIAKSGKMSITVCMTGDILNVRDANGKIYSSREVFLKEMQDISEGVIDIVSKSGMSMKVDYLITDTPNSNTKKNRTADEYGKPKITFAQFKDAIETLVNQSQIERGI